MKRDTIKIHCKSKTRIKVERDDKKMELDTDS